MLNTNRLCVPVIDNLGACVGVLSNSDILRARSAKKDVSSIFVREINLSRFVDRDVVAIYQHKSHLSAKVRLVTQFLAAHFQDA
ncbi:MAG: CBS domain-containing protein [Pseudohongiellaceae bacterium]|jgi:CBS domain-containing protein